MDFVSGGGLFFSSPKQSLGEVLSTRNLETGKNRAVPRVRVDIWQGQLVVQPNVRTLPRQKQHGHVLLNTGDT